MTLPASPGSPASFPLGPDCARGSDATQRQPHVLVIEDDPSMTRVIRAMLQGDPYRVSFAGTGTQALDLLAESVPDLVLLDLRLPDMHGFQVLDTIRTLTPQPSTVVITGESSVDTAVEAMRRGAVDFIPKPFNAARVLKAVHHALDSHQVRREIETSETDDGLTESTEGLGGLVGGSAVMQRVYRLIDKVASSNASVFITGESGTGKDVVARAIHETSPRRGRAFVPLNCGAIPKDLMESELFGHVKGAFTGATADRAGAARKADGGTLFLDELGEMDVYLQSKLLRFIQTGDVQAVGSNECSIVNVRFICATNRNPDDAVAAGLLREDLYYRLNVIQIHLPPLRERGSDIMMVARHFLHRFAAEEGKTFRDFTPDAQGLLMAHRWPGNVREMQNVIRRIVVLNDGPVVSADMLPDPLGRAAAPAVAAPVARAPETRNGPATPDAIRPLWLIEKEAIEAAIHVCDGNIVQAAAKLHINPSTIYRKRQTWSKTADAAE